MKYYSEKLKEENSELMRYLSNYTFLITKSIAKYVIERCSK